MNRTFKIRNFESRNFENRIFAYRIIGNLYFEIIILKSKYLKFMFRKCADRCCVALRLLKMKLCAHIPFAYEERRCPFGWSCVCQCLNQPHEGAAATTTTATAAASTANSRTTITKRPASQSPASWTWLWTTDWWSNTTTVAAATSASTTTSNALTATRCGIHGTGRSSLGSADGGVYLLKDAMIVPYGKRGSQTKKVRTLVV